MNRRDFLHLQAGWVAASCLGFSGCPPSPPPPRFDPLAVETFGSNVARPDLCQDIVLTWTYNFDDSEIQARNSNKSVKAQRLFIHRLHVVGVASETILPGGSLGSGATLTADTRSFAFKFNGPIVVRIEGSFRDSTAADGSDFRPNATASLTLRLRQELFCRATFRPADEASALYPYLGYSQDNVGRFLVPAEVEFTHFVAFHDSGTLGQVDLAARVPTIFPPERFFRAFSTDHLESQNFGTQSGSSYPPGVFSQPLGVRTSAMLFAGTILFGGTPIPPGKGNEPGDARGSVFFVDRPPGQPTQAMFVAVPMLFLEDGSFRVADIHAGSATEMTGQSPLVLTALSTPGLLDTGQFLFGNLGTISGLGTERSGGGLLHTGQIKAAQLVHRVRTLNGSDFTSVVDVDDLSWKCQFLPDDQLENVISLGQQESLPLCQP